MADGDLVVANYQVEIRSLLLGPTTSYKVQNVAELIGRGSRNDSDGDLAGQHGGYAGTDLLPGEVLPLEILVEGSTDTALHAAIATLRAKWVPGATVPLTFQLPSIGKRRIYGRTRDFEVQISPRYQRMARISAAFYRTDPRSYAHTQNTQAYNPSQTIVVANGGDTESLDVTYTFAATSTGPRLVHNGLSLHLDFDTYTISGTSYIATVSSRSVYSGSTDKYGELTATSEFFGLSAGDNSLTYTTDSGSGTLTVAWRNAYL